jgi:hypothetical protein
MPLFVSSKEKRLLNEFFDFSVRKFPCRSLHTSIVTSGWNSALFVMSGWKVALFFSSSDLIVAHLILTLVAYIAVFLSSAPYFKSNHGRISTVCDDQYSSTIAMLQETPDEAFKVYMTSKTQG